MNSTNLYLYLKDVQQPEPLQQKGQIKADLGTGMCRVELAEGGLVNVRNPSGLAVYKWVYVKEGSILGEAPVLPYVLIEI